MLFFLIGPFLLFSDLSSLSKSNLVTAASMDLGVRIIDNKSKEIYHFPLFETKDSLKILNFTENKFESLNYPESVDTKFFDYD